MKTFASLATLAIAASALELSQTADITPLLSSSGGSGSGGSGTEDSFVPENYANAWQNYDLSAPFVDQECY